MRKTTARRAPLAGIRIVSVAPNLPGPAALKRCRDMGATCIKLEAPSGDPMRAYNASAYEYLHERIAVRVADLKSEKGQRLLQRELARADVVLTSSRPSTLATLGLGWKSLHARFPSLSHVAIVGWSGARVEEPGHDLTYLAEQGLVRGLDLPSTLYADMAGSLMVCEAVLQAVLQTALHGAGGVFKQVALSDAAALLAWPKQWGLTAATSALGGAYAFYRVYACLDGRVAVAALEGQFAAALCIAAGIDVSNAVRMTDSATAEALTRFFSGRTRTQLLRLARECGIPLQPMPQQD
jgi:alpha-methylacyl-CoA racemase